MARPARTGFIVAAACMLWPMIVASRTAAIAQQSGETLRVTVAPDRAALPVTMGSIRSKGSATISGKVLDAATGQPVAGAVVSLGYATDGRPGPEARLAMMAALDAVQRGDVTGPIAETDVRLLSIPRVITDQAGRFSFVQLPAGVFNLLAAKNGFVEGAFGRLRPEGECLPVKLGDAETRNVEIRLFRMAAIEGRVTDGTGEPLVGIEVSAYRYRSEAGLSNERSTRTDDRGVYRLGNLVPGEYFVGSRATHTTIPSSFTLSDPSGDLISTLIPIRIGEANVSTLGAQMSTQGFLFQDSTQPAGTWTFNPDRHLLVRQARYYPASATVLEAARLRLGVGEQSVGIDFDVPLVETGTVSGRLDGPGGPASGFALRLFRRAVQGAGEAWATSTAIADAQGRFVFLGVPAGDYVLESVRADRFTGSTGVSVTVQGRDRSRGQNKSNVSTLWVFQSVSVAAGGITEVALHLQPGLSISGTIEFAGARPPATVFSNFKILAESCDAAFNLPSVPASVDSAGRFELRGLVGGRYVIRADGPDTWMLETASLGSADVADVPLDLSSIKGGELRVRMTAQLPALNGTVRNRMGQIDPEATVLVFPKAFRDGRNCEKSPRRLRRTRVAADGSFSVERLPPGEYLAVAVSDALGSNWNTSQTFERLASQASQFLVQGQSIQLTLVTQAIPTSAGSVLSTPVVANVLGQTESSELDFASGQVHPDSGGFDPAPTLQSPTLQTGRLAGRVMTSGEPSIPVANARVIVRGPQLPKGITTSSDSSGRFVVESIPPGFCTIVVSKPAFLDAYAGSFQPGRGPGVPVAVRPGETVPVDVQLHRGGVIAGQARDEFGDPVAYSRVVLTMTRRSGSDPSQTVTATTDDLGRYRAFGLVPGQYVVSLVPAPLAWSGTTIREVSTSGTTTEGGRPVNHAPVFYPGMARADQAVEVNVPAGGEVLGIDLLLRFVPTAAIAGSVLGPDVRLIQGLTISLSPESSSGRVQAPRLIQTTAEGRFAAQGLSPGKYRLTTLIESPPPAVWRSGLWASTVVDVDGQDVTDVRLTLQDSMTLAGRLTVLSASTPVPSPSSFRVTVRPMRTSMGSHLGTKTLVPDQQGGFRLSGLPDGTYRVGIQTSPATLAWGVRSVTVSGQEEPEHTVVLRPGSGIDDLRLVVSDQLPELSGVLLDDAGAGISGFTMMLFSVDRTKWTSGSRFVLTPVQVASDGSFKFWNVPAGEYYLATILGFDDAQFILPDYLEAVVDRAIRVSLKDGEHKVQDLRISK